MSKERDKRPFLKDSVTKHAAGKVERRARIALYIGIGIGLAAAVFMVLWLASVATVIGDLLPVLVQATMIPLIIVTFYLIGVLDADEDIYKEAEADIKARIEKLAEINKGGNHGKS